MSESENKTTPKATRTRRRVYEAPSLDSLPAAPAGPDPAGRDAAPAPDSRPDAAPVIRRYVGGALALGLVPLPLLDTLTIAGLQLALVGALCRLHGREFSSQRGRALLAALMGGVGSVSVATGIFGSLVKLVPGAGLALGVATLPAAAAAATYAVGRVFDDHLAAGGGLEDFDPAAHRKAWQAHRRAWREEGGPQA